ncbi:hypothetical protein CO172_02420 [Candidatus Uhrbacteria bacterium CG_4_9_14_3_um_filter_36_7]|uniref:DDH domain-containing protein n=1 Tax=Candidatus Uhrbacteria bacterium CG_4_9_14_3_um_filter_36_7 TaxID=1975033 RepID=A0A2M7XHR1_9BACT|nr:MAG: hypothetical protein CO172_02420 [Candidatus Uhrbacteria bacterium CG_4_9_14_3_um_filter_36_7]
MNQPIYQEVFSRLLEAKHILCLVDERLDGDSLGSTTALADYLLSLGKSVTIHVSTEVPKKYALLPHLELCQTYTAQTLAKYPIDLVITFDCSDEQYVEMLTSHLYPKPFLINIDHHLTNTRFGNLPLVFPESPSTTEIIHQFFRQNHLYPSTKAATALLCGIAFDTGIFMNESTGIRAFESASELILEGAQIQPVIQMIFSGRSIDTLRVWGIALDRLYLHQEQQYLRTFLTSKDIESSGVNEEDIGGAFSNFLSLVTEIPTIFFLYETGGGVKVSMRSTTKNIGSLARLFGGGGHKYAGGFFLANTRLVYHQNQWSIEERKLV